MFQKYIHYYLNGDGYGAGKVSNTCLLNDLGISLLLGYSLQCNLNRASMVGADGKISAFRSQGTQFNPSSAEI